ncbi:MAG TPA: DUF6174 domain-containing protein [Longimicrobium sp.]|nr:DUF6174 domain-containing protein [Longimicrobium sp.]
MRSIFRTLFVASLVLAGACRTPSPADAPAPLPAEAAAHRRTWEAARPAAYVFTYERMCFCVGPRGRVIVEVRGNEIVGARFAEGGAAVPREEWEGLLTVDGAFQRIAEAARSGQALKVEYDATLGYPTRVEIGSLAADAGINYILGDLRPAS